MPLVSVIIPTYRRAGLLLDRALPSVWAQTERDFEVIVVGDGTDQETIERITPLLHPRFRFENLPHYKYPADQREHWCLNGIGALNRGLDLATGDWVSVLADDDEWPRDHLERLLAHSDDADVVYGDAAIYNHAGKDSGQRIGKVIRDGKWDDSFCDGANIWRRSLGFRYDPECLKRHMVEDGDLWQRMMNSGARFRYTPEVVLHYYAPWAP